MALIAEFSVPAEEFALADALERFPEVVVEAGELVAHSPDTTMPCLWASGADSRSFAAAVEADPTVAELEGTAETEDAVLVQVSWTDAVERFVARMVDHEGVILEATGRADRWRVRLRFMTRDQFDEFQAFAEDWEKRLRLEQLFEGAGDRPQSSVTRGQRRALVEAAEAGYFDVPRSTSIEPIAAELGVSHQAVSERLRRGTATLVKEVLGRDVHSKPASDRDGSEGTPGRSDDARADDGDSGVAEPEDGDGLEASTAGDADGEDDGSEADYEGDRRSDA